MKQKEDIWGSAPSPHASKVSLQASGHGGMVPSVHLHGSLERLVPVFNGMQKFYFYCTQTMCGFKINYAQMPSHNWSLNIFFVLKRWFLASKGEKDFFKKSLFPSMVILLTLREGKGKKGSKLKISFLIDIFKSMYMCVYTHTHNHTCTYTTPQPKQTIHSYLNATDAT